MAELQTPILDYPYPDGVTDQQRNANTPSRSGFDVIDDILLASPVSDHPMLEQELCEAFNHGCTELSDCVKDRSVKISLILAFVSN